jgi:hypothetical protein
MRNRFIYPAFFIGLFILLLVILAPPPPVLASDTASLDSPEIGLQYIENIHDNGFHDFWKHGRGAELFIAVPLDYGNVQSGMRVLSFDQRFTGIPGFNSYYFYLGLGGKWTPVPLLGVYAGIDVGSELMSFDERVEGGTNLESEFAVNLRSRLSYLFRETWALNLSGNYEVIMTHKRIHLFFFAVGLSRSFSTPGWVKGFFE